MTTFDEIVKTIKDGLLAEYLYMMHDNGYDFVDLDDDSAEEIARRVVEDVLKAVDMYSTYPPSHHEDIPSL